MRQIKNIIIRVSFLIFIVTPLSAWFFVKPVRLIVPELVGVKCFDNGVCLENEADYEKANTLRLEAIEFLNINLGAFENQPRIVFCSTWECANKFGLGKRSAVTLGAYASAISPRAWKSYYVRHELIHQLQVQKLGLIKCLLLPPWLIEGMAYSQSHDPRQPLNQPWEGYRSQFDNWLMSIESSSVWSEAASEW